MKKILVSAMAVGAAAAVGSFTVEARAESASGPVTLNTVELDAVKGGIRNIRRSFNRNTISSVSNGNITQGNANTTVSGGDSNEVTAGNAASSFLNIQANVNNAVVDLSAPAP